MKRGRKRKKREGERGEEAGEKRGGERNKAGKTLTFALCESESLLSFHFLLKPTCELENDSIPREKLTHKSKAQAEPASPPTPKSIASLHRPGCRSALSRNWSLPVAFSYTAAGDRIVS